MMNEKVKKVKELMPDVKKLTYNDLIHIILDQRTKISELQVDLVIKECEVENHKSVLSHICEGTENE